MKTLQSNFSRYMYMYIWNNVVIKKVGEIDMHVEVGCFTPLLFYRCTNAFLGKLGSCDESSENSSERTSGLCSEQWVKEGGQHSLCQCPLQNKHVSRFVRERSLSKGN